MKLSGGCEVDIVPDGDMVVLRLLLENKGTIDLSLTPYDASIVGNRLMAAGSVAMLKAAAARDDE